MIESILYSLKKVIPHSIFAFFQPAYHISLSFLGAVIYGFPSRRLKVVAVTGTKGKTSVTELVNAILEEAGYETAVSNTIRFKIGKTSEDNLYKMSMPGRFFIQKFLKRAAAAGCTYAVIEVTSQGALLHRHRFICYDALIFTNLAPEHIEAHGSYENYVRAKLAIAEAAAKSTKKRTLLIANADDKVTDLFLKKDFTEKRLYSLDDAKPYDLHKEGFDMTVQNVKIHSKLSGEFNIYNELAAITLADAEDISIDTSKKALEKFSGIRGRVEKIDAGQDFTVIVDYAHTPDSLQKLYNVYKGTRRICVLGNTGGGRDTWKRDEMAKIAESECDEIILTNEDPYDDNPRKIVDDMAQAISPAAREKKLRVIMDRREAIAKALSLAHSGDSVLITGKGTDPYIMGPNNAKQPWSDAKVAREELVRIRK
ncbi:MAG TPA: UDP-N-acetylmuramyl-tripeptide synthetase [Candidatus Paceibacterota bacterium]|nr:UDP-N-acetylmuramyl-tripeptide synthetase [Candidatus Paceibacterota bacterium]